MAEDILAVVKSGDLAKVKAILDGGWFGSGKKQVHTSDKYGRTPLHAAADQGHWQIAEVLLERGAAVNARDTYGKTPLHHTMHTDDPEESVCRNKKKTMELLVARGAGLEIPDGDGRTPLLLAVEERQGGDAARRVNKEMVEYLLSKGGSARARTSHGLTVMHLAVGNFKYELVDFFLAKGMGPDEKDGMGYTPFFRLIQNCESCIHEAEKTSDRERRESILRSKDRGSKDRDKALAEKLLAKGADVNTRNNEGRTPLAEMQSRRCNEMVAFLQSKGAVG